MLNNIQAWIHLAVQVPYLNKIRVVLPKINYVLFIFRKQHQSVFAQGYNLAIAIGSFQFNTAFALPE